jgi:SAM-dependent methyltransferase
VTAAGGGPDPEDREAERLRETYRRYAGSRRKRRSWSAANPGNVAIRGELLAAVLELAEAPLRRGGEVLDVGCSSGWLLSELASRGVGRERLHGVDLIETRVAAAAARVPGADVRGADARALPFEEGRFELITMLTALSSMSPDAVASALREARRVASSSAVVLCYEPRISNPFNRATSRVSLRTLEQALGPAIRSSSLTGFPPLARRLSSKSYPMLARIAPTHRITSHEPGAAPRRRG